MATYRIKAPDGRTYQVQGPAGATQAQVQAIVKANLVRQAQARIDRTNAPQTRPTKKSNSFLESVQGGVSTFLDGVLPGAAGVTGGVGAAIGNAIAAPLSDKIDFAPGQSFKDGRRFTEENQEQFKRDHGTLATVGTGAGMIAGIALPVSKIGLGAKGVKAGLGARTLNAGANGAIMGGASGAASSHADSLGGFVGDTARGTILGGATGSAFPITGRVAKAAGADRAARAIGRRIAPVIRKAGEALPGSTGRNLQNRANIMGVPEADMTSADFISRQIDPTVSPRSVVNEVERRQAMGVPAAPADVQEGLRSAYGTAARQPGPAQMAARRAIDERQRAMTQRVSQHVEDTLGPVGNVEKQSQALTAKAKEDAAPLYATSNNQNIPYVGELQELMERPISKSALRDAATSLLNEGKNPRDYGMIEGADGVWSFGGKPTMEAWDYFKSALDRQIFAGKQPFAPMDVTRDMRGAISTRGRLLDIMDGDGSGNPWRPGAPDAPQVPPQGLPGPVDAPAPQSLGTQGGQELATMPTPQSPRPPRSDTDLGPWTGQRLTPEEEAAQAAARGSAIPPEGLNPFWKPAREAYAGPIQDRQALELGENMAGANATDVGNRMDGMTGSQLDQFALGHRTGLVDDVQKLGDYGNAARRVDGSLAHRDALDAVHGPERAGALGDRLQAEHEGYQTWAAVRGNSMTAGREAEDAINKQEQSLAETGQGLWALATGRPMAAGRHFAAGLSGEPALTRDVNANLARDLSSTDLENVAETFANARRASTVRKARTKRSIARDARTGRLMGSRIGAGAATQDDQLEYDDEY